MTANELLKIADQGYPDGMIAIYAELPDEAHGDTLAEFIVRELTETHDETESTRDQLHSAMNRIATAMAELQGVYDALHEEAGKVMQC